MEELTEREILILLRQEVQNEMKQRAIDQAVVNRRLDSHASDIKSLREWRFYYGGVFAAIGAYLGLGKH